MSLFSCPACVSRTIQSFSLDQSLRSSSSVLRNSHLRTRKQIVSKRYHATYESLKTGHHKRMLRTALSKGKLPKPNHRRKAAGALSKTEIHDAQARDHNRKHLLAASAVAHNASLSPAERKQHYRLKQDVEQYYSDPLQLANVVTAKLRIPDLESALALVRASEGIVHKNVVSWNHCIDWCMSQGDTEKAWKLYNELKKRGHRPDSHTYTIMLRGFSQNSRKAASAERAVGIFNSMFAPNSAVQPNTIHTNAALNVCARKGDMESLWAIAGRLPERGPGSPDRWTFTTILNAVREDATSRVADMLKDPKRAMKEDGEASEGMTLEDRQKIIFDQALNDARRLWADVSHRWRRADLMLDEKLVCAMGRLILGCGTSKDLVEIFDLVDSTMNIRLAERGHKKETAENRGEKSLMPLSEQQIYVTPSQNTLSLILKAAQGAKEMKLGKSYWHLLTTPNGPYKIVPDADNIISYLRLLRVSRSSKDALDVLSRDWPAHVADKLYRRATFVVAMSTCIRDKNNPGVFNTADKLMDLMQNKLEEAELGMYQEIQSSATDPSLTYKERKALAKARAAKIDDLPLSEDEAKLELQRMNSQVESLTVDPKALRMYIDLAVLKTPGWNEGLKGRENADETFERDPRRNTIVRALRRLGPEVININRLAKIKIHEAEIAQYPRLSTSTEDHSRNGQKPKQRDQSSVAEKLEDLVDLLRTTVSAYDKIIDLNDRFEDEGRPTLPAELTDNYRDHKRKIAGFLSRAKDEIQRITRGDMNFVKWRQRSGEDDDDVDEDDEDDGRSVDATRSQKPRVEVPQIAREVRRVYEDTDASLGRLEQRSRRQRLERAQGVEQRMRKRLGVGEDVGMLDEELQVEGTKEVIQRMRERASNIRIDRQD